MKCATCGKEIKNAHHINGKVYGYNCYKMQLAIIFKQFEDEKNHEYAIKCFSAMEVFASKKSNSFHDSIVKQWNDCKKLTARQLECVIKGFSDIETIEFYKVWFLLTNDNFTKKSILSWIERIIDKNKMWFSYMEDETVMNIFLSDCFINKYKNGFHFYNDIEIDSEKEVYIMENGRDNKRLKATQEDEYLRIYKIIKKGEF